MLAFSSTPSNKEDEDSEKSCSDIDDVTVESPLPRQSLAGRSSNASCRSVEYAIDLMIKIVIQDIKSKAQTFDFLKKFDGPDENEDSFLQYLVVVKLVNYFCRYPKVQYEYGDSSILVNLSTLLTNLEQLIPANPFIILKSIKLINSMAFKNSMEVRKHMKYLKMFELRD